MEVTTFRIGHYDNDCAGATAYPSVTDSGEVILLLQGGDEFWGSVGRAVLSPEEALHLGRLLIESAESPLHGIVNNIVNNA
jgi:hypothetical protein